MVKYNKNILIVILIIAIAGATWIIVPSNAADTLDPHTSLLTRAIASYYDIYKKHPQSLEEVEELLEMTLNTDCTITKITDEQYNVTMPIKDDRIYHLSVVYSVNQQGIMEKYNVRIDNN